jgi:hypothetical protein
MTTTDAFRCFGPQGINGCGFEQHLESMYKGLKRTENAEESSYGFLRANAILSVVFITDEADCSHNNNHSSIFLPVENGGNEVFWSDPDNQSSPTSAVCWNAGVTCTGGGTPYDECHATNKDIDGNEVSEAAAESDAVLHPLARYVDLIQAYETAKQDITPGQEVLIASIDGVPMGYETGDVDIIYQNSLDPQDQLDFGIGPACETANGKAVPSVRIREFAEAFEVGGNKNLYSICADDYGVALEAIAEAIRDQIKPACMPACVADSDPLTPDTLEPNCTLTQVAPNESGGVDETDVPECGADGSLPDGENVCYVELTGAELDPYCDGLGYNLQFLLNRRPGFPAPGGTSVSATCQLSQQKAIDCPNLP